MKKFAFIFLAFLLVQSFNSSAQSSSETPFRFGLNISPTFSWMGTNDKLIEGAGTNLGLKLGVNCEKFFAPNYAVFLGLGFGLNHGGTLQYGYESNHVWTETDFSDQIILDTFPKNAKFNHHIRYFEIPFGLKLIGGSNENSRFRFYAEPGLTLGFRTGAKGDVSGTNGFNTDDEDIKDDVNGLSMSWAIGVGAEYEVATSLTVFSGFTFQRQFTDATDDNGTVLTKAGAWKANDSKASMNNLVLRLGVYF